MSFCCCPHWPVKSLWLHPTLITYRRTKCLCVFDMKSIVLFPRTSKTEKRKQKLGPPSVNICLYYLVSHRVLFWGLFYFWYLLQIIFTNYDLNFASYTDDTTPCIPTNGLIANSSKSHFLTSPYDFFIWAS